MITAICSMIMKLTIHKEESSQIYESNVIYYNPAKLFWTVNHAVKIMMKTTSATTWKYHGA